MRLTSLGVGVLAGGLALTAAGAGLGFTACLAVGVVCLVLVGGALLSVAGAPKLSVGRLASPPEVSRHSPATVQLTLRTSGVLRRATRLIERVDGVDRVAEVSEHGRGDVSIAYPLDTSRRGVLVAGPLVARRGDPFGLVVASTRLGGTCSVRVRPQVHHLRMLPSGRRRDLEGPTRERSEGTASFHQIREYQMGDDLRRVHWATTARAGTLMVKQMVDTTKPELMVVLDNRRMAMPAAEFEEAVDIAASMLRAAEQEGFPTTLLFSDGRGESATFPGAAPGLDGAAIPHLDRLTEVRQADADSLLELGEQIQARGRSLVFVTGEITSPDVLAIARIARGFLPAYLVSVARERTMPLVAPPGMTPIPCATAAGFAAAWQGGR